MFSQKKDNQEIRARMAPSPTGAFHIGSARTALFNFLFAKKQKGKFILRIEDTDKTRSKKEWEENIYQSFAWLGILPDESPQINGEFAPYRQSERTEIYQRYLENLLKEKKIYRCFCTPEELESQKNYLASEGLPQVYSGACRQKDGKEIAENIAQGKPFVWRFLTDGGKISFNDILRGKIEYDVSLLGDFVIAKSFQEPLYNFACVVDDYLMRISHVIRGEEHISNTPRQLLLIRALGFVEPLYMHLPLILNEQRAKLSKRDPNIIASVVEYKEKGYLPQAVVNFIAFLGWNPGDNREVFSLSELIDEFSVEKIQKSGAVFNKQKLDWLNGYYIRQMALPELTKMCLPYLIKNGLIEPMRSRGEECEDSENLPVEHFINSKFSSLSNKEIFSFQQISSIVNLYQERLKNLSEIGELCDYFFKEAEYETELLFWKKWSKPDIKQSIDKTLDILSKIKDKDWQKENLEKIILPFAQEIGKGDRGLVLWPMRVALSGKKASAGPTEIAIVLGKEKTLKRLKIAIKMLS